MIGLTKNESTSGADSATRAQVFADSFQHRSNLPAERRCKPSPSQLFDYLKAPSAIDPYTGVAERAQNPERYMTQFLEGWDKLWENMSAEKDG